MSGSPLTSNFSEHPLVALAAAFASGVLLARYTSAPPAACITLAAFTTAPALVLFLRGREAAAARLVLLAFACAGAALSSVGAKEAGGENQGGGGVTRVGDQHDAGQPTVDALLKQIA